MQNDRRGVVPMPIVPILGSMGTSTIWFHQSLLDLINGALLKQISFISFKPGCLIKPSKTHLRLLTFPLLHAASPSLSLSRTSGLALSRALFSFRSSRLFFSLHLQFSPLTVHQRQIPAPWIWRIHNHYTYNSTRKWSLLKVSLHIYIFFIWKPILYIDLLNMTIFV